jgi:hypothetical protein
VQVPREGHAGTLGERRTGGEKDRRRRGRKEERGEGGKKNETCLDSGGGWCVYTKSLLGCFNLMTSEWIGKVGRCLSFVSLCLRDGEVEIGIGRWIVGWGERERERVCVRERFRGGRRKRASCMDGSVSRSIGSMVRECQKCVAS